MGVRGFVFASNRASTVPCPYFSVPVVQKKWIFRLTHLQKKRRKKYGCRGTWVQYQGAAPGCSTWVQYLGAAPGCRGTWVEHLGAVPGCSTRVLHLGAVPGCSTAPGCSTWGGAPRKGWVAPAPREGCRTPPGVPPLVAHLCHTATIIIWKAHPVRGGAPRRGYWRVLVSTGEYW